MICLSSSTSQVQFNIEFGVPSPLFRASQVSVESNMKDTLTNGLCWLASHSFPQPTGGRFIQVIDIIRRRVDDISKSSFSSPGAAVSEFNNSLNLIISYVAPLIQSWPPSWWNTPGHGKLCSASLLRLREIIRTFMLREEVSSLVDTASLAVFVQRSFDSSRAHPVLARLQHRGESAPLVDLTREVIHQRGLQLMETLSRNNLEVVTGSLEDYADIPFRELTLSAPEPTSALVRVPSPATASKRSRETTREDFLDSLNVRDRKKQRELTLHQLDVEETKRRASAEKFSRRVQNILCDPLLMRIRAAMAGRSQSNPR